MTKSTLLVFITGLLCVTIGVAVDITRTNPTGPVAKIDVAYFSGIGGDYDIIILYKLHGVYKGNCGGLVSINANFTDSESVIQGEVFGQKVVCNQNYTLKDEKITFNSTCLKSVLQKFGANYPTLDFKPVSNTIRVYDSTSSQYNFILSFY